MRDGDGSVEEDKVSKGKNRGGDGETRSKETVERLGFKKERMDKKEESEGRERCLGMLEFITEDCRCLHSMAII